MTRDEAEARGRRALAAGWVWQDGALFMTGDCRFDPDAHVAEDCADEPPDFRDPATVGVLRAQVAERAGGVATWADYSAFSGRWAIVNAYQIGEGLDPVTRVVGRGPTEVDALLAALEGGR